MAELWKQDRGKVLNMDELASCRIHWIDGCNAMCLVHKQECACWSAFGNFCEHPEVLMIRDDRLSS